MDFALTWFGRPNGEKLPSTVLKFSANSTKVGASHCKATQVHASPGQTELQVDSSFQPTLRLRAGPFDQDLTSVLRLYYFTFLWSEKWLHF